MRLAQEKIRIYQLANQLNMHSKDLLELCQRHGIDVRNQLSTLDPDQRDQVVELIKRGADPSADGRLRLINPKATVALLESHAAAK